jgi:hypothetical protein
MIRCRAGAPARANPIDTAVAAIKVESASAIVAISCTSAPARCWRAGAQARRRRTPGYLDISISANQLANGVQKSRAMPAGVRPDWGEAIEEWRRFREAG